MADQARRPPGNRPSGPTPPPHLADELEVYFNEYVRGSPVGFVSTPKWLPPTDIYETEDAFVVVMDIAGVEPGGFTVTFDGGVLTVSGERLDQASGRREYHAMEVKVGPFERHFRFAKRVDPASLKATYEVGFLEIRLAKVPETPKAVRVDVEAK
ncbi:MAG: Hsp20/alpha crystallin family protein [Gemmatimonadales bacterium]|jgi:HSP20 family protein